MLHVFSEKWEMLMMMIGMEQIIENKRQKREARTGLLASNTNLEDQKRVLHLHQNLLNMQVIHMIPQ